MVSVGCMTAGPHLLLYWICASYLDVSGPDHSTLLLRETKLEEKLFWPQVVDSWGGSVLSNLEQIIFGAFEIDSMQCISMVCSVTNVHNGVDGPIRLHPLGNDLHQRRSKSLSEKYQKLVHNRCTRCNLCIFTILSQYFYNTFTIYYILCGWRR